MLIVFTVFIIAIILGQSYPNEINGYTSYTQINLTNGCNTDYLDSCIYRQLIYRASLSLVLLFTVLAIFSYCLDFVNRGFWVVKFAAGICVFIGFWWADNNNFSHWANVARFLSFFWLLVQGLLIIDFTHDIHDIIMGADTDDSNITKIAYLALSLGAYAAAIVGLVFLFMNYTGCSLGMFFTVLTLFMGVLTSVLSMLNVVNKGILTPSLIFAYSVFMCWYICQLN
jgi:hypothetical protein